MSRLLAAAALALATVTLSAQGGLSPEEFESKLGYKTGTVQLTGGMATINVPAGFRFIAEEGSRRVITAWGNPPEAGTGVLGMLVPADVSPVTREGWGIVITYEEDGYVDDDDARTLDYDKMLAEMKEQTAAANEERQKEGYEPITLVGWAEPPHYDAKAHKLYWAKELTFGNSPEHTLNYAIRILGRRGVLVLNAVSGIDQLRAVKEKTPDVLTAVEFNEGHRYADFLPGTDKTAAYGVGGLILGATAAKAGFFKMAWLALLASKKLVLAGVIAVAAGLKKLLSGRNTADA
jgi:uncharacterized membrane-anchored protein